MIRTRTVQIMALSFMAFLLLLMLIPESAFGVFPEWMFVPMLLLTSPYVIFLLAALGWFAFRKARGQSLY